jgi:hypothetical protein
MNLDIISSETEGGQARQEEGQVAFSQPEGGSSEPPFLCPLKGHPAPGQCLRHPQLPCNLALVSSQRDWRHFLGNTMEGSLSDSAICYSEVGVSNQTAVEAHAWGLKFETWGTQPWRMVQMWATRQHHDQHGCKYPGLCLNWEAGNALFFRKLHCQSRPIPTKLSFAKMFMERRASLNSSLHSNSGKSGISS